VIFSFPYGLGPCIVNIAFPNDRAAKPPSPARGHLKYPGRLLSLSPRAYLATYQM
jgi:hypothetical protein